MTYRKGQSLLHPDEPIEPDKFSEAFQFKGFEPGLTEKQFIESELDSSGLQSSFFVQLCFFISYSVQDVFRRKVLYLIAFSAVFVSILSILMIDVFVKKGSLIFVKMSEDLEIDAQIRPGLKGHNINRAHETVFTDFRFNMTKIDEMMD